MGGFDKLLIQLEHLRGGLCLLDCIYSLPKGRMRYNNIGSCVVSYVLYYEFEKCNLFV